MVNLHLRLQRMQEVICIYIWYLSIFNFVPRESHVAQSFKLFLNYL